MLSLMFRYLSAGVLTLIIVAPVAGQEEATPVVIAMDQPTADLWKSHFPATPLKVLVRTSDEAYQNLNLRALSVCGASHLIYRSDCSSSMSQLFRERLANQGVSSTDLVKHVCGRLGTQSSRLDLQSLRVTFRNVGEISPTEAAARESESQQLR